MISNNFKLFTGACIVALSSYASASPSSPTPECITGITNLLKIVGRPEFFDESPENFVKNSTGFLQIAKNETSAVTKQGERYTTITLKSESWLNGGTLRFYSDDAQPALQNARFREADIDIKKTCSPKYKDFLVLSTKNIKGQFSESALSAPSKNTLRVWSVPDPEEGWERRIEVNETDEFLSIKVVRAIDSDEEVAE
ncbi:MAG TPA: hypothetical protein VN030_13600 [Cellvibrio sp.]|nr:hypothetical protein [Cellvibrio sp.]